MKFGVKRLTLATFSFIAVAMLGSTLFEALCLPAISHQPVSTECKIVMYSPVYAAIVTGLVASWKSNFWSLLFAFVASAIGLAILWRGSLSYWHGADILYAIQFATLWCLVPALITSSIISGLYLHGNKMHSNQSLHMDAAKRREFNR